MTELERRADIVAEALSWVDTPFRMNACIRGVGVDCGRFPRAVLSACGVVVPELPPHWPRDFMHHKMAISEPYLDLLQTALSEVSVPLPGDVALFKAHQSLCFSHAAIVIDWPRIIHARGIGSHPCVEESTASAWPLGAGIPVRFFSAFQSV